MWPSHSPVGRHLLLCPQIGANLLQTAHKSVPAKAPPALLRLPQKLTLSAERRLCEFMTISIEVRAPTRTIYPWARSNAEGVFFGFEFSCRLDS